MKKLTILLTISFLLLLTACSNSTGSTKDEQSNNSDEKKTEVNTQTDAKEDLKVQLIKEDEEAGVTIETSQIYQYLSGVVEENPKLGDADSFTMFLGNYLTHESGDKVLLFMAINRFPFSVKNLNFDLSVGNEEDGYAYEKLNVSLPETTIGVLQTNSTVPVIIPISNEKFDLLNKIQKDKIDIKIENFKYDKVE
ncbi:hypothetical protein [Bacillus marasmi]|uniref:hypothetical protein n=1 Tax=Bacillus marasmi TaxID=1926279 RepID=UPI0011CAFFE3|nr:hypothetical protein [Bacillus marasmi]